MKTKVKFKSKEAKICGILTVPKKTKLKDFCMVFCHGLKSKGKYASKVVALTKLLNKKGVTTFAFDFYAHGESEGDFSKLTQTIANNNLLDAIKFLKKKGYIRFGLFGSSFGGATVISTSPKIKEKLFVCLNAPLTNYKKTWKKSIMKKYDIGNNFVSDGLKYNMYNFAKKINVPTLIVNGDKDTTTPIDGAKKLFKNLSGEKMLVIINGANHNFSEDKHRADMINAIHNFTVYNLPKK